MHPCANYIGSGFCACFDSARDEDDNPAGCDENGVCLDEYDEFCDEYDADIDYCPECDESPCSCCPECGNAECTCDDPEDDE